MIKNVCDIDLSYLLWDMLRMLFIYKTCRVLHHESVPSNLIYLSIHLTEDPHVLPPLFVPSFSALRGRGEIDLRKRSKSHCQLKLALHIQQYTELVTQLERLLKILETTWKWLFFSRNSATRTSIKQNIGIFYPQSVLFSIPSTQGSNQTSTTWLLVV